MSSVNVSHSGDIINLSVHQHNSPFANCTFQRPLLDPNKRYIVGVSGLSVPMNATRMVEGNPVWIQVWRRNVEQDITTANQVEMGGTGLVSGQSFTAGEQATLGTDSVSEFNISRLPIRNLNDILLLLNSWAAVFTRTVNSIGIDPVLHGGAADGTTTPFNGGFGADPTPPEKLLNFGITPGGSLLIVSGTPHFWNHYYLTLSQTAQELLGISHGTLAVTQNQQTGQITRFGEQLIDANNIIQLANVNITVPIFGSKPLTNSIEQRISIHLESDIPINRNVNVLNSQESSNYDLASFILSRDSKSYIDIEGTTIQHTASVQTPQYANQLVLQKRAESITQWSPLLTLGDALREVRLRLFIMYRIYNPLTQKYTLEKRLFPFESEQDFWSCDLKFVSQ